MPTNLLKRAVKMNIQIIDESSVATLLNPANCFEAVRNVFVSMESAARNFPVIRENLGYEEAIYGFKSGFDPLSGALGLKSGGYWPNNAKHGLASHQSTIFMFNPDTGQCRAALSANLITALRTAAAAAVSIDVLARQNSATLGLVGTGHQSTFQLEAALRTRTFERVLVWNRSGRDIQAHKELAALYKAELVETDLRTLACESDTLITITSSFAALIESDWISAGTHLACMGTDTKGKQEIDPRISQRALRFTDEVTQSMSIGEFQHLTGDASITSLGAVISGKASGRDSDRDITVFDGTGVGLQDLACAQIVLNELDQMNSRAEHSN